MTIKEIAQLAGVSASTVSKIINEKDSNIHPETRSRVLAVVKKYNYVPYANIKAASSAKTFILGVLRRCENFHDRLVKGILQAAQAQGYNILLFDSANSYDEELKHITALCRIKVDGVIWEPVGINSLPSGHYLAECNIPVCYVNTPHAPSACNINFRQAGYKLAESLISRGHKKIACLLEKELLSSQLMLEGVQKCLYDRSIPLPAKLCFYSSDPDYIQEVLDRRCSAVISSSYPAALDFFQKAEALHCAIPEDISLCSLRDDRQQEHAFPAISTLEIPYQALGACTAEAIINNIEKDEPITPESFALPYRIAQSDTICPPAASHSQRVLVAGSILIDILLHADALPETGKTASIVNSARFPGGQGIYQAVGCSRLGCDVTLIGKIGRDNSFRIYDFLQKEKIAASGVCCDPKLPTGQAYIYIPENGQSAVSVLPGANSSLSAAEVRKQEHLFREAKISLVSSGLPRETLLEVLRLSRKYRTHTIFHSAGAKNLPPEFIPYIDILVLSQAEASALYPQSRSYVRQADHFYSLGIRAVILTLGPEGLYLKCKDRQCLCPAVPRSPADTAGRNDAFLAALAACLLKDIPLEQAVRIAGSAAGLRAATGDMLSALADQASLEACIAETAPDFLKKQ